MSELLSWAAVVTGHFQFIDSCWAERPRILNKFLIKLMFLLRTDDCIATAVSALVREHAIDSLPGLLKKPTNGLSMRIAPSIVAAAPATAILSGSLRL